MASGGRNSNAFSSGGSIGNSGVGGYTVENYSRGTYSTGTSSYTHYSPALTTPNSPYREFSLDFHIGILGYSLESIRNPLNYDVTTVSTFSFLGKTVETTTTVSPSGQVTTVESAYTSFSIGVGFGLTGWAIGAGVEAKVENGLITTTYNLDAVHQGWDVIGWNSVFSTPEQYTAATAQADAINAAIRAGVHWSGATNIVREMKKIAKQLDAFQAANPELGLPGGPCFAAGTSIKMADGSYLPIEAIEKHARVAAFPELINPCDADLLLAIVTQIFRNVIDTWVVLTIPNVTNQATGRAEEITSTPGHVFLSPDGQFRRLCDMIDTSIVPLKSDALAHKEGVEHYRPIGMVEIVLEDGTIAKAEAHSIKYSAATAHLYEEAEMLITRTEGGLAVKPEMKKGWKTYNFEVEKHHTYIADGIDPAANDNFRGRAAA